MLRSPGAGGVNVLVRSASQPPRGREDVRLDAAAGGGRGGSGPPGGPRPEDLRGARPRWAAQRRRRRRDRGARAARTNSSTATVPPPDPSADRLGRDGVFRGRNPRRAELEGDTKSCHHGADSRTAPSSRLKRSRRRGDHDLWSTGARATRALGSCGGSRLVGRPRRVRRPPDGRADSESAPVLQDENGAENQGEAGRTPRRNGTPPGRRGGTGDQRWHPSGAPSL